MNQTQVLDEAIQNQHQDAYLRRQNIEIESGIYNVPMNWTPVEETSLMLLRRTLEAEETDFMRARLMLSLIRSQIGYITGVPEGYELRRRSWAEAFRDEGTLMMLIRIGEAETNLFLRQQNQPRRNHELRWLLRDAAERYEAAVSSEETNLSPTQQHQFQPLFRRLRAVLRRLRTFL